jgi:WD40 repeat protein
VDDAIFIALLSNNKLLFVDHESDLRLMDLKTRNTRTIQESSHASLVSGGTFFSVRSADDQPIMTVTRSDLATGKPISESQVKFARGELDSCSVALSADGKRLAILACQRRRHEGDTNVAKAELCLLNAARGAEIQRLTLGDSVYAFTLSLDGKLVAVVDLAEIEGSARSLVRIWEVASGKEKTPVKVEGGLQSGIHALAFAPDGESLFCTASSGFIRWDWKTGKKLRTYPDVGGPIAFFPDGKTMAVQGLLGSVRLCDIETGKDLSRLPSAGMHVAFSSRNTLAWSEQREIVLADAMSGKETHRWRAHSGFVGALAFAPDGKSLASAGADGSIRLWEVSSAKEKQSAVQDGVHTLHFSTDGGRIMANGSGGVFVWDADSGKQIGSWKGRSATATLNVLAVPDARARRIHIIDLITGKVLRELKGYSVVVDYRPPFDRLAPDKGFTPILSPDGRLLLAGSDRQDPGLLRCPLCLWDVATGKHLPHALHGEAFVLNNTAFSPDGRVLALMQSDGMMCLWSTSTGQIIRKLGMADDELDAPPVFTADSRMLITAVGGLMRFWEVATGGEIARRAAHKGEIRELVMSANGRLLASLSKDHTALVWDLTRLITETGAQDRDLEALWKDLASLDAAVGRRAVERLIADSKQALLLLRERLRPTVAPDRKRLAAWIADLESDNFERRRQAVEELERVADVDTVAATLQKAITSQRSLEARRRIDMLLKSLDPCAVPARDALRSLRAVQVLETIGGPDARAVLRTLAGGVPSARQTEDAKKSLDRLKNRS